MKDIPQEEHAKLIEIANKWRLRAHVAEQLAHYFNSICLPGSSFMTPADVSKEIVMQTERLMKQHDKGITWMEKELQMRDDWYAGALANE